MKIEYKQKEHGEDIVWEEVFEHGCFDKPVGLEFIVEESEWVGEGDDMKRVIKKAKLLSVSIK